MIPLLASLKRDRPAAALNQTRVRGKIICSQKALYRDTRKTQKTCNWTAKTAPCFVHYGWYQDSTPIRLQCSSLHSLSNAYTLYCRAVSIHATPLLETIYLNLDHYVITEIGTNANSQNQILNLLPGFKIY